MLFFGYREGIGRIGKGSVGLEEQMDGGKEEEGKGEKKESHTTRKQQHDRYRVFQCNTNYPFFCLHRDRFAAPTPLLRTSNSHLNPGDRLHYQPQRIS